MTEDQAAEKIVAIAKRVQRNHPDEASVGMLVGAAATLLLAGFTDPRDRHVVHAADRLRSRLDGLELAARGDGPTSADKTVEFRTLDERQLAIVTGVRPSFDAIKAAIAEKIPESTYRLWIEPLMLCGRFESTLLVNAPEGIRAWCERRYSGLLGQAATAVTKGDLDRVRFVHWLPTNDPTCKSQNRGAFPAPNRELGGST